MIIEIYPYNNRYDRVKHYSDRDVYMLQNETGIKYAEAIDVYPCKYTYSETYDPLPEENEIEE